jgi:hypothetical protein
MFLPRAVALDNFYLAQNVILTERHFTYWADDIRSRIHTVRRSRCEALRSSSGTEFLETPTARPLLSNDTRWFWDDATSPRGAETASLYELGASHVEHCALQNDTGV